MTFKLRDNVDKYLKFMTFIRSSSPLTIRHYGLDLKQAFSLKYDDSTESQFPEELSEVELLAKARATFSTSWGSLSLASRNRKAATLKSFFGWAFDQGLLEKDLSMQITCPKVPKKIPHFLSVDEAIAVLKTFESATDPKKKDQEKIEKVLFLLLYGGGLRVSEACAIKWRDLQTERRTLRVLGKGNKERLIVLPPICISALKQIKKQPANEFVFGEKALHTRTAYEIIRRRGVQAELLKPLHPHALRHSFATHLLTSGANLRTLQEMLGHESLQATEKYLHLGVDQLARTLENLHPLGRGKKSR